jgi:hypothetical protein
LLSWGMFATAVDEIWNTTFLSWEPSCISIRNSWRWFIIQDLKLMEEQLFIEHTDLCYSNFELTILNGN